jgi:hypothetical protein
MQDYPKELMMKSHLLPGLQSLLNEQNLEPKASQPRQLRADLEANAFPVERIPLEDERMQQYLPIRNFLRVVLSQ